MNPSVRIAARALFMGIGGFLASLVATLPGISADELLIAINAGYVLASGYIAVGFFTDLEPTIGVTQKGK